MTLAHVILGIAEFALAFFVAWCVIVALAACVVGGRADEASERAMSERNQ
jgi:hypothetical protein